jgi:hypothetical protein
MGAFKILMHILFFIKKMYFYHAEKKNTRINYFMIIY